jgi:dihydrolipoamide dehydrogenase
MKLDGKVVMTSREALEMKKQPKSIIILGAGAIGVEFAYFLNSFGTKVTPPPCQTQGGGPSWPFLAS